MAPRLTASALPCTSWIHPDGVPEPLPCTQTAPHVQHHASFPGDGTDAEGVFWSDGYLWVPEWRRPDGASFTVATCADLPPWPTKEAK